MVIVSPPRVSSTSAIDDTETTYESSLTVLQMRSSSQQARLSQWRGRKTSNLTREVDEASAIASAAAADDANDVHESSEDEDDVHEPAEDENDVHEPAEEVRDGDPSVSELANMTLPDDIFEKLEMLNRDEIAVHKKLYRYGDYEIFCDCTIFL